MRARSRHSTILWITVEYVIVWVAVVAIWLLFVTAWSGSNEGPEFDWSGLAIAALASFFGLVAGHVVWAVRTAQALRAYAHRWRTGLTVIAPPISLVLVVIAVNESLVPWQLWPVVLVAVPAIGAIWATGATARR